MWETIGKSAGAEPKTIGLKKLQQFFQYNWFDA